MDGKVIVAMGPDPADVAVADRVARQFGWRAGTVDDIAAGDAAEGAVRDPAQVAAVLLHRGGLSWGEAIRRVRHDLPGARVITCHRYDEPVDWGEFCELGAFHSIRLPMAETEVRQSLGFVWEAEKRRETMRKDRIGYGTGHVDFGLGAVARGAGAGVGANA